MLWELVHVFFEHRGLLEGREAGPVHDTGASSFLYPFLSEGETGLDEVIEDVALERPDEGGGGRRAARAHDRRIREVLLAAAETLRSALRRAAARRWSSATADRPPTRWTSSPTCGPPRRAGPRGAALDLTEDPSILTAIANDIGVEAIFLRQVIAYGREGDAAIAISTSGNSVNLIEASARRGSGGS